MSNPHDNRPDEINMTKELNLTLSSMILLSNFLTGGCLWLFLLQLEINPKVKFMSLKNMLALDLLLLDNC